MLRKALLAALVALTNAASLTSLRTTDADLLKEGFWRRVLAHRVHGRPRQEDGRRICSRRPWTTQKVSCRGLAPMRKETALREDAAAATRHRAAEAEGPSLTHFMRQW